MAEIKPGETVAVFGASPVEIMAAYSAMIRGASVMDKVQERLGLAEKIGCVGVFIVGDPGAEDEQAQQGVYPFSVGSFFMKGLTIGMEQANVKRYNLHLRDLIVAGRAVPSQIVSHELPLDEAPDAYNKFDKRADGYTKVVLKP